VLTSLPSPWIRGEEPVTTAEEEEEHPGEQPVTTAERHPHCTTCCCYCGGGGGCELLRSLPGFGCELRPTPSVSTPPPDLASSGLRWRRHPTAAAPRLLPGVRGGNGQGWMG
jgi:hypothetical protein